MDTTATSTSSSRQPIDKGVKEVAAQIVENFMSEDKQKAFAKIQKLYVDKKNDLMFVDKFINPEIKNLDEKIRLNHSTLLFLLYKKACVDLTNMQESMDVNKNIFNF